MESTKENLEQMKQGIAVSKSEFVKAEAAPGIDESVSDAPCSLCLLVIDSAMLLLDQGRKMARDVQKMLDELSNLMQKKDFEKVIGEVVQGIQQVDAKQRISFLSLLAFHFLSLHFLHQIFNSPAFLSLTDVNAMKLKEISQDIEM